MRDHLTRAPQPGVAYHHLRHSRRPSVGAHTVLATSSASWPNLNPAWRDKLDSLSGAFETGAMPQIHVSLGALQASKPASREYEAVSGD